MTNIDLYLHKLLEPSQQIIYQIDNELVSKTKFLEDVALLQNKIKATNYQRWALCYQDSYHFSVTLFAILLSQRQIILLPNNQAGTVAEFASSYDALLTDIPYLSATILPEQKASKIFKPILNKSQQIILFTSGSTGNPKKITYALEQLLNEIAALEICFGSSMQNKSIYSTISHQHIYGLLFTVLWPLATGRKICLPTLKYPEDIQKLAISKHDIILVSSPALLKRMPDKKNIAKDWMIFSSGGPLAKTDAINIFHTIGCYPIEVLGSTETGGIAYRAQNELEEKNYWNCLPNVGIQIDKKSGCLSVSSPFFAGDVAFIMSDQAHINKNGQFELLGRIDRIAKIEEKRISLTEIEKYLDKHIFVQYSRAIPMNENRQYIAAIVVLSNEGHKQLEYLGKRKLNKIFQDFLSPYFERILLPKKFRYVSEIKSNKQGKYVLKELQNLFEVY